MLRQLSASLFALLCGVTVLAAAAGPATASPLHFRAEPATVPGEARLVIRDTVFRCAAAACVAPRASSRAELICAALAREVGALRSFSANGRSFDAAELEACNRRAR